MPLLFFRKFTKGFFVTVNIIVAVLLILGCYATWFDAEKYWFMGLLTMASFYLLIALIIFLLFWIFIKPKLTIISLLSIILCINPLQNILPFRFSSSFELQKKTTNLRIMDWNVAQFDIINYRQDSNIHNEMIKLINQYQPDIACFQEMVAGDSNYKVIYHMNDFMQQLNFNDYHYSYNYKEDYFWKTHFGTVIFSKYPIINKKMIMHYPYDYNSIFQYVDIVKEKDTIRVFNIHLQSLRFSKSNLQYIDKPSIESEGDVLKSKSVMAKMKKGFLKRKIQAENVQEEISKSPYPVIVCGDFNDVPNSYAYKTIGGKLQNAFVKKGTGIGRTFTGIAPTLRIDNIFVDNKFSIEQFISINKKLSDHLPLVADINTKPE